MVTGKTMASVIKMNVVHKDTSANWRLSSDAFDVLQCFMAGLDDVIVQIAVTNARKRGKVDSKGEVSLDTTDIKEAAEFVLSQIRNMPSIPQEVKDELEAMTECVRSKCEAIASDTESK